MFNLSLDAEPLQLKLGITYMIIDALYINEIKNNYSKIEENNLVESIRKKIFPYTEIPFTLFKADQTIFEISRIKKRKKIFWIYKIQYCLSTDTGVLIFLNILILKNLILSFDYEELVDTPISSINIAYWSNLVSKFNELELGLILAPGLNSGFDFEGSGKYYVI